MTQTDIETWELTIPDEVVPCWVFASHPLHCPDSIASWVVTSRVVPTEYDLCNACKNRWDSYGNILTARPIK